jgi:hypothetical protein
MGVTTGNGLKAVNIFKTDKTAENVEQFNYIVAELIDRQVIKLA